jgi:putative membrane protein
MLAEIATMMVYLVVGLFVMQLGYFLIDLCIPISFPEEIKSGNKAVGWLSAGIYCGLGYIVRAAIITIAPRQINDLLTEVLDTAAYAAIGVLAFMAGYFIIDLIYRQFNFNEELKARNEAAGIMIFGIFMGLAFVVSGIIQ